MQQIRIDGTQRIDPETVQSYLLIKPGDEADADRLDRSLKALFATGLFADVTLRQDGGTLVVRVVENPIINRIAFEGNRKINEEQLLTEVQLRPRVVYTRTKVQNDVKRMLDLYRRSGRFAATVEPKVIQLPQNRVDLVFEINEGQVTGVQRINFVGNQQFSDGRLREVMQTRESRWWRILSTDDTYDPDRLSFDRELLRKFYLANGYADFRVVSAVAELAPDREGFYITFTIEEGDRYKFGTIDVVSRLRDLNVDDLRKRVTTESGAWYDADKVEQSITALTDAVGSLGYAFVDIRPRINRDREATRCRRDLRDPGRPARLCRAHQHRRQCADARQGHPARIPACRGRRVQHGEAAPLAPAHPQSRLLRTRRGHERAGRGARPHRRQRRGAGALDRRIVVRRRLLDCGRRARRTSPSGSAICSDAART